MEAHPREQPDERRPNFRPALGLVDGPEASGKAGGTYANGQKLDGDSSNSIEGFYLGVTTLFARGLSHSVAQVSLARFSRPRQLRARALMPLKLDPVD